MSPTFSHRAICCSIILLGTVLARAESATITTLLGTSYRGEVILCDEQSISWRDANTLQKLSANDIDSIIFRAQKPVLPTQPMLRVMLHDGTVLVTTDTLPTDTIAAVRINTTERFDSAWETALSKNGVITDRLLTIQGDTVDIYEGVIVAANKSQVLFKLDSETLAIPVTKLVGLLYAAPANAPVIPPSYGAITLLDGSEIKAARWRQDGVTGLWEITTAGGLSLTRPASEIAAIRFTPPSRTPIATSLNPARTEFVYRIAGQHARLAGRVSCTPSADFNTPFGAVRIIVRSNVKLLGEWLVRACEPATPIDLDLTGVDRLEITVDFPDGTASPGAVIDLRTLWLTQP